MVLVLGFLTGLALVAPIGPVALTLFGLGAEQGRRVAIFGAAGVIVADALLVPVALVGAGIVQAVDPGILRGVEVTMGVVLLGIAVATILASARIRSVVAGIRTPFRSLAAMTLVNPLSMVAWMGLALTLPASLRRPSSLVLFGAGVLLASAVWHTSLAAASGSLAPRLGAAARTNLTRVSGAVLFGIGAALVAS